MARSDKTGAANLSSQTVRGLKWTYTATVVNGLLQVGMTAVMSRLLTPHAFGLVAMAGVFLRFGTYFAQMGVGSAIIQKKTISEDEIRVAFSWSVSLGLLFSLLCFAAAPLSNLIFRDPELVPVVQVLGCSFCIMGFSTTATGLLRRDMRFRETSIIDITSYICGYALVGVACALNGMGVWSLIAATLTQSLVVAVMSLFMVRHPVRPLFSRKLAHDLYGFGSRVSAVSFLEFLSSNLDTLTIGRFLGANALGLYNRAFMLVNLPMQYFATSFSRVLFPGFSRIQDDKRRLQQVYLTSILALSGFLLPISLGMAVAARPIVLTILGPQWGEAIPILQLLAVAAPFTLLSHIGGVLCEATARLRAKIFMQIGYLTLLAVLYTMFIAWGTWGIALAGVIGAAALNATYGIVVSRLLALRLSRVVRVYIPALFVAAMVSGGIYLATSWAGALAVKPLWTLILSVLTGGVALAAGILMGPGRPIAIAVLDRLHRAGVYPKGFAERIGGLVRTSRFSGWVEGAWE